MHNRQKKGFEAKPGGDTVALKTAKELSGVVFGKSDGKYATIYLYRSLNFFSKRFSALIEIHFLASSTVFISTTVLLTKKLSSK